jgi:hypothetical protein
MSSLAAKPPAQEISKQEYNLFRCDSLIVEASKYTWPDQRPRPMDYLALRKSQTEGLEMNSKAYRICMTQYKAFYKCKMEYIFKTSEDFEDLIGNCWDANLKSSIASAEGLAEKEVLNISDLKKESWHDGLEGTSRKVMQKVWKREYNQRYWRDVRDNFMGACKVRLSFGIGEMECQQPQASVKYGCRLAENLAGILCQQIWDREGMLRSKFCQPKMSKNENEKFSKFVGKKVEWVVKRSGIYDPNATANQQITKDNATYLGSDIFRGHVCQMINDRRATGTPRTPYFNSGFTENWCQRESIRKLEMQGVLKADQHCKGKCRTMKNWIFGLCRAIATRKKNWRFEFKLENQRKIPTRPSSSMKFKLLQTCHSAKANDLWVRFLSNRPENAPRTMLKLVDEADMKDKIGLSDFAEIVQFIETSKMMTRLACTMMWLRRQKWLTSRARRTTKMDKRLQNLISWGRIISKEPIDFQKHIYRMELDRKNRRKLRFARRIFRISNKQHRLKAWEEFVRFSWPKFTSMTCEKTEKVTRLECLKDKKIKALTKLFDLMDSA